MGCDVTIARGPVTSVTHVKSNSFDSIHEADLTSNQVIIIPVEYRFPLLINNSVILFLLVDDNIDSQDFFYVKPYTNNIFRFMDFNLWTSKLGLKHVHSL